MNKYIFVIHRPFVFLGCIEFIKKNQDRGEVERIFVIEPESEIEVNAVIYLIESNIVDAKKITFIKRWSKFNFVNINIALYIIGKIIKNFETNFILVGSLGVYSRLLAAIYKPTKFIFIDEGTSSFNKIQTLDQPFDRGKHGLTKKLLYKIYAAVEVSDIEIEIFTFVKKQILDERIQSISIQNNFKYLNSLVKDYPYSNIGIFLGTPARFYKINEVEYYTAVEKFLTQKANEGIDYVYYPHRLEDTKLLKSFLSKYAKESTVNIEVSILKNKLKPREVTGTFSTALFSLKMIIGANVSVKRLSFNNIAHAKFDEICNLYSIEKVEIKL